MKRPLTLLLDSDEEVGTRTARALIEREARDCRAVLVLEPCLPGGAVKTARKGVGTFVISAGGVAAHSGVDYRKGVSAIQELAYQVLDLYKLNDLDLGTTVNPGVIRGGSRSNVIADRAELEVDVRVATMAEGERITACIQGLQPRFEGTRLTVRGNMNRPPLERKDQVIQLGRPGSLPPSWASTCRRVRPAEAATAASPRPWGSPPWMASAPTAPALTPCTNMCWWKVWLPERVADPPGLESMKIEQIELREVQMPLISFFETSFGRTTLRRVVLVRVFGEGLVGYGESTAPEGPFYNHESTATAWHVLQDFVVPRVFAAEIAHPREVAPLLRPIRGHNMAKAAVETAIWDLYAACRESPSTNCSGGNAGRWIAGSPSAFRRAPASCSTRSRQSCWPATSESR